MRVKLLKILSIFVLALALALFFKFVNKENKDNFTLETETNSKDKVKDEAIADKEAKPLEKQSSKLPESSLEADHDEAFTIKSEEEFRQVLEDSKPQIIMFGTETCVYCKQMRPYFERLAKKYKDKLNIRYVDADELANISMQYPIQGVPAIMYRMGDGSAYVPNDQLKENNFYPFSKKGSNTIDLMMSFGLLKEDVFEKVIEDVIANAE